MKKTRLRRNWKVIEGFDASFFTSAIAGKTVSIPHNFTDTQRRYVDETADLKVMTYYYDLELSSSEDGACLIAFEGIGHKAEVYLGHRLLMTHVGGYVPFEVDLTEALKQTTERRLFVVVDARDSSDIPPFGHVIDYLTYGGIFRDVYLFQGHRKHIRGAHIRSFDLLNKPEHELVIDLSVATSSTVDCLIRQGHLEIATSSFVVSDSQHIFELSLPALDLWDFDNPVLYTVDLTLRDGDVIRDRYSFNTGFREAIFKTDGFYLNGKRRFLVGLNRHMSFPHVGYAMSRNGQYEDVSILKEELGLNVLRSSHYPPSPDFLAACDELGIALIEEIPGWQHIGGKSWKENARRDLEAMIRRDIHHPSVILWGVRINESVDDDVFYGTMNRIARELDPTRQTTGIRFRTKSSFLEDVYGFNDFSYSREEPLMNPDEVSSSVAPYFVSEHTGHMYPVKTFDHETRHIEQIERHLRIIDRAKSNPRFAGVIGWCAFDYQTHQDFGSGDNICHHGVMDMNRMPKPIYYAYAAEFGTRPVLHVVNQLQNGDYPGGHISKIVILTNLDYVKIYRNDDFVMTAHPQHKTYPNLMHPPIELPDLMGDLLETKENLSRKEARQYKALYRAMVRKEPHRHLVFDESDIERAWHYYATYVSNWGSERVTYRFIGYKGELEAMSLTSSPSTRLHLKVHEPSIDLRFETDGEIVRLPVVVADQNGRVARYLFEPLEIVSSKGVKLLHDHIVAFDSGQTAIYFRLCSTHPSITIRWRDLYLTWTDELDT